MRRWPYFVLFAGVTCSAMAQQASVAPMLPTTANVSAIGGPVFAGANGIVCDGVTRMDVALNALLASSAGRVVLLPPGDCVVQASIFVPSATTLAGAGAGATVLDASSGAPGMGPVISLGNPQTSSVSNNSTVSDLTVKGNGSATTLAGAMSAAQTTLQVAASSGWPSAGPFRATIQGDGANSAETITILAVSGTTWTISRSSTPSAHSLGALVTAPRLDDGIFVAVSSAQDRLYRTEVFNAGDNGLETNGVNTEIAFNYVHGNFTNGVYDVGVYNSLTSATTPSTGINVHDNIVASNSLAAPTSAWSISGISWDGIDIDPLTQHTRVHDNQVLGNDIIHFETNANWSGLNFDHIVEGNVVLNSAANCFNVTGAVDTAKFTSNKCVSPTGVGMLIHGPATNTEFSGNTVVGPTAQCVLVYQIANGTNAGVADKSSFENNVCINSASSGGGASAVTVQDNATYTLLKGFKFFGTVGAYDIATIAAATSTTLDGNAPLVVGTSGVLSLGSANSIFNQPGSGAGTLMAGGIGLSGTGVNSLVGGQNATASGNGCLSFGLTTTCDANFTVALGQQSGTLGRQSGLVYANGDFSTVGDAQHGWYILRATGVGTGSGTLTLRATADGAAAGSNNCINLAASKWMKQTHELTLIDATSGDYAIWTLTGALITRPSSGATNVPAHKFPAWTQTSSSSTTADSWNAPTMTADATNNCVNISWVSPSNSSDRFYLIDDVHAAEH